MVQTPSTKTRLAWLPGGLGALLCVLALWLLAPERGDRLETLLYDRVLRTAEVSPSSLVEIVGIDARSLNELGDWPWSTDLHARLVDRLHAAGADLIAFTVPIALTHSRRDLTELEAPQNASGPDPEGDPRHRGARELLTASRLQREDVARLVEAVASHGNVVLAMRGDLATAPPPSDESDALPASALVVEPRMSSRVPGAILLHSQPAELLEAAADIGFLEVSPDPDGIVRSVAGVVRTDRGFMLGLSAATVLRARGKSGVARLTDARTLDLAGLATPLDRRLRLRPVFGEISRTSSIPVTAYRDVLIGAVDAQQFRDKIVIVGPVSQDLTLPVTIPTAVDVPETLVLADAVASLLQGRLAAQPIWSRLAELLAGLAAVVLAALLLPRLRWHAALLVASAVASGFVLVEIGLLHWFATWVGLTVPAIGLLVGAVLTLPVRHTSNPVVASRESGTLEGLRMMGLNFQHQGQLELAFEAFRKCPADPLTLDLLYGLGRDFERRSEPAQAAAVYGYVSSHDARFRDVSERLEQCRSPIPQAAGPAGPVPDREPSRAEPPTQRPSERCRLGRYEIEREIGRGAMGTVYLGRDPNINRVVAIKTIRLADEFEGDELLDARARFFREAEMAGRLSHPGIVTVYDAGEVDGLAYIAMEYVRGRHLSHHTDPQNLLPVAQVLLLGARIADALGFAHRQNVIHRDIKPANIMFDPETDELKITDFGIARLTDSSRTRTGIVLGTPSFMSPEQLEGRSLDGRSDLFALGTSLYQLLTGQLPFLADSMPSLMLKIATEPHAPARTLRPDLPPCVDGLIASALAKDPADRFQSGGEMAASLRSCAASCGV